MTKKAKNVFIKAHDVCKIIVSEKIQTLFAWLGIQKPSISLSTAQRWLAKMN